MEKLVDEGLVKAIGLSNFNLEQTKRIYEKARIKPANVQVRLGGVESPLNDGWWTQSTSCMSSKITSKQSNFSKNRYKSIRSFLVFKDLLKSFKMFLVLLRCSYKFFDIYHLIYATNHRTTYKLGKSYNLHRKKKPLSLSKTHVMLLKRRVWFTLKYSYEALGCYWATF